MAAAQASTDSAASVEAGDIECAVTMVNGGRGGYFENEVLGITLLDKEGISSRPGGPGHVLADGSLAWKFGWERKRKGQLRIEGRRLDADAPPLRAEIFSTFDDSGFQPVYLIFPTPGCWQITGWLGEGSLTFVMVARKVADRPPSGGEW